MTTTNTDYFPVITDDDKHPDPVPMSLDVDDVKVAENKESTNVPMSLDDSNDETVIDVKCQDGKSFPVKKRHLKLSKFITTALEGDPDATSVSVQVDSFLFEKAILPYLQHHDGVPADIPLKPVRDSIMKNVCKDAWDAEFVDNMWTNDADGMGKQFFYSVMTTLNYLDIHCFLHICSAKIAALIRGVPLSNIKERLLPNPDLVKEKESSSDQPSSSSGSQDTLTVSV